jgi:hypothetical protein
MEGMPPRVTSRQVIPTAGLVVVSLYIAAQMLADIASLKIALVAGFSIDAGTFISQPERRAP